VLIGTEEQLRVAYQKLTSGGMTPTVWKKYDGPVGVNGAGLTIGLRGKSGSGGATIEIKYPSGYQIKLHIDKRLL